MAAQGPLSLFASWLWMDVAISAGFYRTAFSSLACIYRTGARPAISGLARFGSTIGKPLASWTNARLGWRGACLGWMTIRLLLALPLNLLLPSHRLRAAHLSPAAAQPVGAAITAANALTAAQRSTAWLLSFVFGVTCLVSTALASQLPRLLQPGGVGLPSLVSFAALVEPSQIAGRLLEYGLLGNVSPLLAARIAPIWLATAAMMCVALQALQYDGDGGDEPVKALIFS